MTVQTNTLLCTCEAGDKYYLPLLTQNACGLMSQRTWTQYTLLYSVTKFASICDLILISQVLCFCSAFNFLQRKKVKLLSHVRLFATPWTVAYQAPLSMGFSRQGYQSGLPFPSPGDLPNPGIEPASPTLQADTLPSEPPGNFLSNRTTRKRNDALVPMRNFIALYSYPQ